MVEGSQMTGAEIVCESLLREKVEVIFGFPGGALLPFYDTLARYPLRHVLVRHEQCAAHAADGYARATGKVGVCLATSGPGATNLVTGIANAYLDSSPIIAFTGQVARPFIGKDAFQEVDITGITLPITKYNYLVQDAVELARTVREAFYIARTGRPGPVLIDIPRDVFEQKASFVYPEEVDLPGYEPVVRGHPPQIRKAAELINQAERPVIVAGRGVIISGACSELKELAEKAQIPVATAHLGIGSFPETHFLSLGKIGMHGTVYGNLAVNNSDLVIGIGTRFSDRTTGKASSFCPMAKVIHIDIDPSEIGKNIVPEVPIVGDAKNVLGVLIEQVNPREHVEWLRQIEEWRQEHPSRQVRESEDLLPQYVIQQIYEITRGEAIVVTGVGQNQMWTAQHYFYSRPNSLISSGGLGTMGFELPGAIGALIGCPEKTVWSVAGDGGFQMTLHELATVTQENIPLKMAIINNGYLGMVRQWQELFYGHRYVATPLSSPDFVKIAEAYGIAALRVKQKDEVVPALQKAMETPGPFLIDFMVEPEENVFPMIPPGASIAQMLELPRQEESRL